MRIAISGGMGFEEKLLSILKNFNIILVGAGYNLKSESFGSFKNVEFFSEFLTHNYLETFSDVDIFIDISQSNKSKYLISDFKAYYGKKCYLVFYENDWKIAVLSTKNAHFSFVKPYIKSIPFIALPGINLDNLMDFFLLEKDNFDKKEDFIFEIDKKEKIQLNFENFNIENYGFEFMNGQIADIVSVSCSDNSVAISPMNEVFIDLSTHKKYVSNFSKILKENPFFLEFKIEKYRVVLFRQGRVIVKGTKEKNTALFIYYNFIGN